MRASPPRRRRQLRRDATDAERVLWRALRDRAIGAKFRRQHPIEAYVLDFYCPVARLAVELDGSQHFDPEEQQRDAQRSHQLALRGIAVLRFTNTEAFSRTREVLEEIFRVVEERTLRAREPSSPSPARGRGSG